MGKKEFKIGEEFQFGLIKLKCIKSNGSCLGCFFNKPFHTECAVETVGHCFNVHRTDRKNVIFIDAKDETI